MNCNGCIHAEWKRTSSGRLHPDKSGRCTYLDKHSFDLDKKIPGAFSIISQMHLGPGFIKRDEEIRRKCAFKTCEQVWGKQ